MDISLVSSNKTVNDTRVGWVNEPDSRGTLSVLITCLTSLFVCSWTVMHLNIPPKHTKRLNFFKSNFYWSICCIIGPELVIWTAWRQLMSAMALRKELRKEAKTNAMKDKLPEDAFTLVHGFYTLMGGFVLDFDASFDEDTPEFTRGVDRLCLTPKGLLLLARCGHLPLISEADISDKSKTDELGKLLACVQAAWMVFQVCARIGSKLPITLLEVASVAHVVCAFVLYGLWWYKPRQILEPTVLKGDWAAPLAAFMIMCSRTGITPIFPGLRLENERYEIVRLRFAEGLDGKISARDFSTIDQVHEVKEVAAHTVNGFPNEPDEYSARISIVESSQDNIIITQQRRQLACDAIEKYPAIRNLLKHASDPALEYYEKALAIYPEMPQKCRQRVDREKGVGERGPWLECKPHDLVSEVASNWPNDGLLRNSNGLGVGAVLWAASIAYSGIHIAAWNATFPSTIEAWLWRSASLYIALSGIVWAVMHVLAEVSACLWWKWYDILSRQAPRPLMLIMATVCSVCGCCYLFSRAFLIVEAFASLRSLPSAVYILARWTLAIPHLS